MTEAKSVASPVDPSTKLIKDEGEEEKVEVSLYQSAVGSYYICRLEKGQTPLLLCVVWPSFALNPERVIGLQ